MNTLLITPPNSCKMPFVQFKIVYKVPPSTVIIVFKPLIVSSCRILENSLTVE